jgi:TolB protein
LTGTDTHRGRGAAASALAAVLMLLLAAASAWAPEVRLSISKGFGEKVIIALPLFEGRGSSLVDADAIRDVLTFDLGHSGYFSLVENREFVDENEASDLRTGRIDYREWLALGAEVLVKGKFEAGVSDFSVEATVYDLESAASIFGKRYSGPIGDWRAAVHALSDDIVERLTGEPGIARTRIAFVSDATGMKEIYLMDYDGEHRLRLTRDSQMAMYPAWFPDGKRLAYTRFRGSRQEICTIDVASGATKVITSFPGLNAFPAVSPRGDEILAALSRDGNPEIYRLKADGSDARRLTYGRSTESSPCWSPDGRRIGFVSDRSGTPQIYVMSASGGTDERVTYQGGYNTSPDWSPKGDLIAYTSRIDGVFQICTVDVETKEVVRLTTGGQNKEDPSWAPDGRHIAYSEKSGGKSELYMLDVYDLTPVRLTSGTGDYLSPAWSR